LGIADNIRGFFRSSEIPTEQKNYGKFPTSNIVFPFNTDAGYFSGVNQMSPEGNSAALACLNVLGTAFSEPPLKVYLKNQEGMDHISNHPAEQLISNPNPNMTASLMNNYIVTSVAVYGDAFILKLRNDAGAVVQLIPLLPDMVEVKGTNEQLITKYEYKQKGNTMSILPEDMIHLRERIDPRNHRRGLAPLRSVMVEVLGDAAASQMGAALVKNTGVPSVVISPKNDLSMTSDEAENIAEVFGRRFGGENRGRPLVISGGEVDIKTLSFSPKDLEIGKLRYINEERISAVLGVPAILAGLGSGLERATYSNAKELREFFTEQKLIPMWNHFANEFTKQLLLQDFEDNTDYCFKYDISDVRALSQDEDATMQRVVTGFNAGFVTVNEARQANQLPALDDGDYFIRNMMVAEVPVEGDDVVMYHAETSEEVELKDVSKRIEGILRDKVKEHNDKDPKYRATYSMLRQVFERGVGAYNTNPQSVRPNVTSSDQWALARVNTFIRALSSGRFRGRAFDTDLLPEDHPRSTKKEIDIEVETKVDKVPSYIQKNAARGLDLLEYAGSGLTDKTKREAREMANGNISDDKVVRMAAWFARHEGDLDSDKADDYLNGDSDRPTAGQVAWLLWGGDISKSNKMRAANWATKEAEKVKENKSFDYPLYGWQEPTVKFLGLPTVKHYRTEIEKKELWEAINGLENAWSEYMSNIYAKELNRQRRGLANVAKGSHDLAALETNVDIFLNESKFDKELLPLFYSLGDDMSVRTFDNLFPAQDNFKAADPVDLGVQIEEEQAIRTVFGALAAGAVLDHRTFNKIVEGGFYRGQREVPAEVVSLFQDSQAASFVQENAKKVMNDLNATTKKRITTQITKTIKEFEDLGIVNPVAGTPNGDKFFNELAKRINTELGGQNLGRAKNIARTEVGKVSSWAQQRAAKATGKNLEKEWVSRRDGIVREAHFELDNQRVPLNSFYLYNGIKLDAPRDPNAPISLIANCRCTEAYIEVIDE
jgi:HK97 family phage portal protein